jgi:hypothetical protein
MDDVGCGSDDPYSYSVQHKNEVFSLGSGMGNMAGPRKNTDDREFEDALAKVHKSLIRSD